MSASIRGMRRAVRAGRGLRRWQALLSLATPLLAVGMALAWHGSVAAQEVDFSGEWQSIYHEDSPERIPGPDLGDYSGIPINAEARMRGDTYDPLLPSAVPELTCRQHGADYSMRGLSNIRITVEYDPVTQQAVAFHTRMGFQDAARTVWLDGRAHPSKYAPHTWQGFSTGVWDGDSLVVTTTHLKASYLRRNGLAASADRTFTEHWVRHGNYLSVVTVIDDPDFLTEPLVRSESWVLNPGQRMGNNPCEYVPEQPVPPGTVPNYLPGKNPWLQEFAQRYGLPLRGVRGGADTIYPEDQSTLGKPVSAPAHCTLYCQCMNVGSVCNAQ
jgi:hypothetical protein